MSLNSDRYFVLSGASADAENAAYRVCSAVNRPVVLIRTVSERDNEYEVEIDTVTCKRNLSSLDEETITALFRRFAPYHFGAIRRCRAVLSGVTFGTALSVADGLADVAAGLAYDTRN